ncbi:glycosyltransferase family 4 protein [Citrobacter sedlakii]|uniref:glycosyltransferase family 4 protein n=1 Tax=Citrobacter sedlakii TaxID=67826 RepID=UPI00333796FE
MNKIIYDGIISSLQAHGGVTVYYKELLRRLNPDIFKVFEYDNVKSRLSDNSIILQARTFERYRDCVFPAVESEIFHSTYYRLPEKKKEKIITTVHDFTYEKYMKGFKKYIHTWQKYRAIRNSNKIICVSRSTANDLLYYCDVEPHKIEVIYNGVSDNYYIIDQNKSSNNYVVFIGARAGYKNFDKAVEAVAMTKDLKLIVVGGGSILPTERKFLDEKLNGRYTIAGVLSDAELNKVYNEAYCLLYPSEYEGFGIPVLEAMKSGCPVIAVNRSSIPEVAGDAAVLVDDTDKRYLFHALLDVETNRSELRRLGKIQSSNFSWDKCYKQTMSIYNAM